MNNTPDSPAKPPDDRTDQGGNYWTLFTPGIWKVLHAVLERFVGDADPLLVRAPGSRVHRYGSLWLLSQGESRRTQRVQLFIEFISKRFAAHTKLLAGRRPAD